MWELLEQAFRGLKEYTYLIQAGSFDLMSPSGSIIAPENWEAVVRPGWRIKMVVKPLGILASDRESSTVPISDIGCRNKPVLQKDSAAGMPRSDREFKHKSFRHEVSASQMPTPDNEHRPFGLGDSETDMAPTGTVPTRGSSSRTKKTKKKIPLLLAVLAGGWP